MSHNSTPRSSYKDSSKRAIIKSQEPDFKNPNDYLKRNKPNVLDEDTYTAAIDHIIERDFFPDLRFLRERQKEIISLSTPDSTLSQDVVGSEVKELNLDGGLDSFFKRYTSEDNDSFSELLDKQNSQLKEKFSWLHDEKLSRPKLIQNPKEESTKVSNSLVTINKKTPKENSPQEKEASEELPRLSKPIQTWKYTPKNSLMYHPEGCYSSLETSEAYLRAEPKSISHHNTRLKGFSFESTPSTPSTVLSSGPIKHEYVESTPAPDPSALADENPMTWGFLDSTPVALSVPSTPGPSFQLPEPKKRELLGIKLSDKARSALRARQASKSPYLRNKIASMQSPGTCLSPAGRRLLENTQKIRSPLIHGGDRQLRQAYSKKGATPNRFSTPLSSVGTPKFKNSVSSTKKPDNP